MDWKRLLFNGNGRIGRKPFWLAWLAMFGFSFAIGLLDALVLAPDSAEPSLLGRLAGLALIWPQLTVTAKRLHDLDRSGWWQAAPAGVIVAAVVPYFIVASMLPDTMARTVLSFSFIALLAVALLGFLAWVGFARGAPGPNRYGLPDSGVREVTAPEEVFE